MATVIFKPTEMCNARCRYCDVVKKPVSVKRMSFETLDLFFRRVDEFLRERPEEHLQIIWHGGEPLLLGIDYFEQALAYQQKWCATTRSRINHSIQSNLTVLKREMLPVMRKLGITSFGTSYEPIDGVRGIGKNRDSRAYNRRFVNAVRLLDEEDFGWGIIYVVTKKSLGRALDIFNFLGNLSDRGGFMFNPVELPDGEGDDLRITPEEYADFLGEIFAKWWPVRGDSPAIQPFDSAVRNLASNDNPRLFCTESGNCANTHISVMPDGSASQCGRAADLNLVDYGNIRDKSFGEIFDHPFRKEMLRRNEVLQAGECKDCRFWDICHGGCPMDPLAHGGSLMHKTTLCRAKQKFLGDYVLPAVEREKADGKASGAVVMPVYVPPRPTKKNELVWVDPVGGLGDALMLSSVLKLALKEEPSRRFNLVDRTKYRAILEGHPAIAAIGHPPKGASLLRTHYWAHPDFAKPDARAFQILAAMFGLKTPAAERLYVPWKAPGLGTLGAAIPWRARNVLIGPGSESPRKEMPAVKWEAVVAGLAAKNIGVVQAGRRGERYIRGAYSLLGLTSPRQLVGLVKKFDAVITGDSFLMHAAKLCGVPAVVLWGPTRAAVYGYQGQRHLTGKPSCRYPQGCIGPGGSQEYQSPCPEGEKHCLNLIATDDILAAVAAALRK